MAQRANNRYWRLLTIYLRRFRIVVLFISLLLLGAFFYLNQIGLPGFAKRPLLSALRERGVDLEFSRLRLRVQRGLVADDVRFGAMGEPTAPQLFAREVEIKINRGALLHRRVQVDELRIRDGSLEWRLDDTNAALRSLTVNKIETRLRLLPADQWVLDEFNAQFAGALFRVSASITNATAVRDWDFLKAGGAAPSAPSRTRERLRELAEVFDAVKFSSPPEFNLDMEGDARDLSSFAIKFAVTATDADTPWGRAGRMLFTTRLFPASSNELSHAEMQLEAADTATRWANATRVLLRSKIVSLAPQPERASATLTLTAGKVETPWATAYGVDLTANWIHAITNPVPLSGDVTLSAQSAFTRWARGESVRFRAALETPADVIAAPPEFGFWTNLLPYQLVWDAGVSSLKCEKIPANEIRAGGSWSAATLTVTNLHAGFSDGSLDARAQLHVPTRELAFSLASDFDVKQFSPQLSPQAQAWLGRLSWAQPPHLRGQGVLVLPAWTNAAPDWEEELSTTLQLTGEFAVTNGTYRGIHADWAHGYVSYTNFIWQLPDLRAAAPQGALRLEHWSNDRTREYYFNIHSTLHPDALKPVLTEKQKRAFDFVSFATAPVVDAELRGRWHDDDSIGFRGNVAVTNITVRKELFSATTARLDYTNNILRVFSPRVWEKSGDAGADGLTFDFDADRLYFTNGLSSVDPFVITRAIGPITHRTVEPYRFVNPPKARVNGYVSLRGAHDVDVHFDLDGGPFEWWRFHVPQIRGHVHWMGDSLVLTNMQMVFYEGWADGDASFNFAATPGTDFAFTLNTTNSNLHLLLADLYSPTNSLEGQLSGTLAVTNANSDDNGSWNGHGHAQLRDGLIWSFPAFGILSKPLDAIVPGLGSTRITEATAKYTITNSIIHSSNLEMRTPASRLQYKGTVNFNGQINARVEAELFRDTWLIGRMVSVVLWPVTKMFEYKVTGRLNDPKLEPLYIPKLLMMPLHPIRTLEELFPPPAPATNAPPAAPVPASP